LVIGGEAGLAGAQAAVGTLFSGSIGDAQIEMEIKRNGENLTGSYYYRRSGSAKRLTLKGTISPDGAFMMREMDAAGKQTGEFKGRWGEAEADENGAALSGDKAAQAALTPKEGSALQDLGAYVQGGGLKYLEMMSARPQAVGYGSTDSPAGLAGWMLVHSGFTKWTYGDDPEQSPTRDEVLDNFSLYWLTNTAASSARIYWENRSGTLLSAADQKSADVAVPVAITVVAVPTRLADTAPH
jgi:hypothetical protein